MLKVYFPGDLPVVPLSLNQSMDLKTALAHISVSMTFPPSSEFAFSTSVPIDITIFREITAPAKQIPIVTSFISVSFQR